MSEFVLTYEASPGAVGANMVALYVDFTGTPCFVGNDAVVHQVLTANSVAAFANMAVTANFALASATAANVGNATMNTPSGQVTASNATTQLTVTNSLVTANSKVGAWAAANDVTGRVNAVVPNAGNFIIYYTTPTANMPIDFVVFGAA